MSVREDSSESGCQALSTLRDIVHPAHPRPAPCALSLPQQGARPPTPEQHRVPPAGPTPALRGAPAGASAIFCSAPGGQTPAVFGQIRSTRFSFFRDQWVPGDTSVLCRRCHISKCALPPSSTQTFHGAVISTLWDGHKGRDKKLPETLPATPAAPFYFIIVPRQLS